MKAFFTILALSATLAPAATIQWGGEVWGDDFQSNGTSSIDDSFTFELGTFDASFVPSVDNYNEWLTNWNQLDSVQYNAQNMFFTGEVEFIDADPVALDVQFNGQTFAPGDRAFIWGYNSQTASPNTEAILITGDDGYLLPESSTDQSALPVSLRVSNSTTPVVGDLPAGPDGEGDFTNPGGDFDLQTATVPEPSSALLLLLGAALLFRRR